MQNKEKQNIQQIADNLYRFIKEEILIPKSQNIQGLTYNTSLVRDGWLDSIELLELITSIESDYNVFLGDEVYTIDNMKNINSIASMVASAINAKTDTRNGSAGK